MRKCGTETQHEPCVIRGYAEILSSATSSPRKAFQRFMPRKIPMRKVLFCKDFCEEPLTHKITRGWGIETLNCVQLLPLSSNPPYATFLFHSAAQAYKTVAGSKSTESSVTLAFCWSHVRRGFYDLAKAKAPIATETLQRIAALYEIEARVRGKSAADRLAVRQVESKPLVTELRAWFEAQIAKLPARGPTAQAIRYALNHWDGLERFLEDGRIELDNNSVERAMRPVALSRKNSLFAGSDEGAENWACLASLIETCKLNGVNPQAYFTDLLTRLVNGWPQKRIDELMPWCWVPERPP